MDIKILCNSGLKSSPDEGFENIVIGDMAVQWVAQEARIEKSFEHQRLLRYYLAGYLRRPVETIIMAWYLDYADENWKEIFDFRRK